MRQFVSRIIVVGVGIMAALWFATGPASAVTPQQCEQEGGGKVHWVLNPDDPTKAVCTCRGGFYKDMDVYGPHVITVNGVPMAVTCTGLEVGA